MALSYSCFFTYAAPRLEKASAHFGWSWMAWEQSAMALSSSSFLQYTAPRQE